MKKNLEKGTEIRECLKNHTRQKEKKDWIDKLYSHHLNKQTNV